MGPLSPTGAPGPVRAIDRVTVGLFQSHGETNAAVLAFIVLSGYCIHRNGVRRHGSWSAQSYAVRRFFRIVPVFVLASAVGAGVALEISPTHSRLVSGIAGGDHVSAGCLAAKLTGAAAFAPQLLSCSYQGNAPLNTVMVEVWLYVVYGFVMWMLLRRVPERVFLAGASALSVAAIVLVATHPAVAAWWQNSSLLGFLPYWWIGAFAVGVSRRRREELLAAGVAAWFALTIVLAAPLGSSAVSLVAEARKLAFAIAVAGLIVLLDSKRFRLPRSLTAVGRSGYSLYAFHGPIVLAFVVYGLPWWGVYPAVIVAAAGAYLLVELPWIRIGLASLGWLERASRRRSSVPAVA